MRKGLIVVGALVFVLGLAALISGLVASSVVVLLWGAILVALMLIERFRYKRIVSARPGVGWERTTERFVDEDTGKIVTVYVKPETGERAYVAD